MTYEDCILQYGTVNEESCSAFEHASVAATATEVSDPVGNLLIFIFLVGVGLFLIALMAMSFKIIRQQQVGVVERLGRYNRSLNAGFHAIIPFFEYIEHRVDLEQEQIEVTSVIKTKEHQVIDLPVEVIFQVVDAKDSVYVVAKPRKAIKALISNEIKATAATMTLQEIYDDRESIKSAVIEKLGSTIATYGFNVLNVVIDNPEISREMEKALNNVAVAEKKKEAAVAEAAVLKIKAVAIAEADAASLIVKGDAYVGLREKIATGNAAAIKTMIGDTDLTPSEILLFLSRIDSNDAVRDAAESGATVVIATGDSSHSTLGMVAHSSK